MRIGIALVLAVIAAPACAQTMKAQQFYQRATALKKKGAMAIFSGGEIKALMAEGQKAGKAARDQRLVAARAGKPQRYCPPEGPQAMSSDEFMTRLGAIPQAERAKIDMTEATIRLLAVKYPC